LRDWGYAPDYVATMHSMLQQESPEDFVIATGVLHSVRDFLERAFSVVTLDYRPYTGTNPNHYRPSEVVPLCGDASKARRCLGWAPTRTFDKIVEEMVFSDIKTLKENK
jgi:GDPmannose 4,6-dehydratase